MAKAKKKRAVSAWSKDDVRNLRAYAKAKLSGTQTAKKLKRSPGAVAQKAMKLGVRFRSIKRKAG
jgi:ferric-dicitrate binding protein FerR (iron transport regulator)